MASILSSCSDDLRKTCPESARGHIYSFSRGLVMSPLKTSHINSCICHDWKNSQYPYWKLKEILIKMLDSVCFTSNMYILKARSSNHISIFLVLTPGLIHGRCSIKFIENTNFKVIFGILPTLYPLDVCPSQNLTCEQHYQMIGFRVW